MFFYRGNKKGTNNFGLASMSNLVGYLSSGSESESEEETLTAKRQKLANVNSKIVDNKSSVIETNSIASILPPPKNKGGKKSVFVSKDEEGIMSSSISHRTGVLGGAIKNQFNGASILSNGDDVDDFNDEDDNFNENNGNGINSSVNGQSSVSSISFLPSWMLRKKKQNKVMKSLPRNKKALTIDEDLLFSNISTSHYRGNDTTGSVANVELPKPAKIDTLTNKASSPKASETARFQNQEIPKSSKIVEFNVDDFYQKNNELLQTGELAAVDPTKANRGAIKTFNAHGKNQLSSLIRFANDETNSELLKEKFKKEKQTRQNTRGKYGW